MNSNIQSLTDSNTTTTTTASSNKLQPRLTHLNTALNSLKFIVILN